MRAPPEPKGGAAWAPRRFLIVATSMAGGGLPAPLALAAGLRARGHHVTAFGDAGLRHTMVPLGVESLAHDPDYDLAPRDAEVARETEGLPLETQGERRRDMLVGWAEQLASPI